jgi:hypothetical protein
MTSRRYKPEGSFYAPPLVPALSYRNPVSFTNETLEIGNTKGANVNLNISTFQ